MRRPPVPRSCDGDGSPAAAPAALAAAAAAVCRKVGAPLVAAIGAGGFEAVRARSESMSSLRSSRLLADAGRGRFPATPVQPPPYRHSRRTPCVE